jgi:hypothetical protein
MNDLAKSHVAIISFRSRGECERPLVTTKICSIPFALATFRHVAEAMAGMSLLNQAGAIKMLVMFQDLFAGSFRNVDAIASGLQFPQSALILLKPFAPRLA